MATTAAAGGGGWKPVLAGVVLAAPFAVGIVLFREGVLDLLALLLALTGGIYVGGALADARKGGIAIESAAAAVCLFCAALGFWWTSAWIAWGYLFHAAWDVLHHRHTIRTPTRRWFPSFCIVFDVLVAAAILFLR